MITPSRQEGQGLVEYALILVLVAIVVIAILLLLGPTIGNVFSNVVAVLEDASGGGGGGGGSQVVTITLFNASGSPGALGGCDVRADVVRVKVTKDGSPVSGASVSVALKVPGAQSSVSGTTGSDGTALWTNVVIGTASTNCNAGNVASASAGSSIAYDSY